MALKVEGIVNGGMHVEKTLGRARRLEALHLCSRRLTGALPF
jgi:hypothetical protein